MTVPCTGYVTAQSRYAEARYDWLDRRGHGAARNEFVLYGRNGSLVINNAQISDTERYTCTVTLAGNQPPEAYDHNVLGRPAAN